MMPLLYAELVKIIKQSKTYYALGAIVLIELLILLIAYYQGSTILDLLLDSLKQSFYFEGTLLNGNLIMYIVLNSLWFNVPLILMIITSGFLTDEYKDGTLQTVMLQAVKKKQFILAKYVVAILFTVAVMAFMMLTTFALAYAIFGKGDLIVYIGTLNFFESDEAFRRICLSFISGAIAMVFYNIAGITFAIFIKESSKTWIVAALFLVVTNLLLKVDLGSSKLNTLFFPKLVDTWQQLFVYEVDWIRILSNNVLLVLYSMFMIILGTYVFDKKDIG
ncbi:ABC transporter permease [Olivibacter sp. XZL3]|uniref:ABC transporter permease n=1 Tax=Olivibacter sp. XZL3 TaxID=1735116 RepID=UPI0010666555|nr:ABC transporter permease [Olivibacter sp. XZL3]